MDNRLKIKSRNYEELVQAVQEYGHLKLYFMGFGRQILSVADERSIADRFLIPALREGDCYAYAYDETLHSTLLAENVLAKSGRKTKVRVDLAPGALHRLLTKTRGKRPTLVLTPPPETIWRWVSGTYDPTVLVNLSTVSSPAAVRAARKLANTLEQQLVILIPSNQDLSSYVIFVSKERSSTLFDEVLSRVIFSENYKRMYCVPDSG